MKRKYFLQVLCLLISCLYSNTYAQTAKFTINGETVNLQIEDVDPTEYKITEINDTCSILDYKGEIKKVKFFERPMLENPSTHILKGDNKIIISKRVQHSQYEYVYFRPSEYRILSVIRDNQILHQYITYKVKKLSQEEINDKINIEPNNPIFKSEQYNFSDSDTIVTIDYSLRINLPETFRLNDIKVWIDEKSVDFEWSPKQGGMTSSAKSGAANVDKKTTIRLKVKNSDLTKESVQVKLSGNITSKFLKESQTYEKDLITLYKYNKPENNKWKSLLIIGGILVFGLLVFYGYCQWIRKKNKKTREYNDPFENIYLHIELLKTEKKKVEEERDTYKRLNEELVNQLDKSIKNLENIKKSSTILRI